MAQLFSDRFWALSSTPVTFVDALYASEKKKLEIHGLIYWLQQATSKLHSQLLNNWWLLYLLYICNTPSAGPPTLPSNSFHGIHAAVFGIHLTGHCAAKRSTVKWRREKLQSDKFLQRHPPPPKHHVSWRPANPINQQPSPQKLSASIVLLHGQVHPLSAHLISTLTHAGDECFITSFWGRKKKTHNPCVFRSDLLVHLCSFLVFLLPFF